MKIRCIWEHNGDDSILYSEQFAGSYTRGESRETALWKMATEICSYTRWRGDEISEPLEPEIVQEKESSLNNGH